jgi:hypothetical protein
MLDELARLAALLTFQKKAQEAMNISGTPGPRAPATWLTKTRKWPGKLELPPSQSPDHAIVPTGLKPGNVQTL